MANSILIAILRATAFRSPFLRTFVPCAGAAVAIQALFGVPSVLAQSERLYDASGALTHLAVAGLSLYLPAIRNRAAAAAAGAALPKWPSVWEALAGPSAARAGASSPWAVAWNWRQVVATGLVAIWATRLGYYLFSRILSHGTDSRFDKIRGRPAAFSVAWFGQAVWVTAVQLPVVALNSVPAAALAAGVRPLDLVGFGLWAAGFAVEAVADRQKSQWLAERARKEHDEVFLARGLWARSRYPNYFGEITLWTGMATAAAAVLISPAVRAAAGISPGLLGGAVALGVCAASPLFTSLLLLKVSGVPLSEGKYDKKYGDRKDYQEWKRNTPLLFPKLF